VTAPGRSTRSNPVDPKGRRNRPSDNQHAQTAPRCPATNATLQLKQQGNGCEADKMEVTIINRAVPATHGNDKYTAKQPGADAGCSHSSNPRHRSQRPEHHPRVKGSVAICTVVGVNKLAAYILNPACLAAIIAAPVDRASQRTGGPQAASHHRMTTGRCHCLANTLKQRMHSASPGSRIDLIVSQA